jgi:caffeoyl-CoA O-methyltransferase
MRRMAAILSIALATTVVIIAQRPGGMGPFRGRGRPMGDPSSMGNPPLAKTEEEKKILTVLDSIVTSGEMFQNVPAQDGRMLRLLTETAGAKNVVEIGTSTGYSGLWLCLALRATGGSLTTFEIDSHRASIARENFKQAGVDQMVKIVQGDAHANIAKLKGPIDVVFLDADKEGYLDYVNKLLPLVRSGGLILAHNVGQAEMSSGYVKALTSNPDLETAFYMEGGGLSITLKKR